MSHPAGTDAEINRLAGAAGTEARRDRAEAQRRLEEMSPGGSRAERRRQRLFAAGTGLLGVSLILTGINLFGPGVLADGVQLTPAERERYLGQDVIYTVNVVVEWRASRGSLPPSLKLEGLDAPPTVRYERTGNNRFTVVGEDGQFHLVFNSDTDGGDFERRYGRIQ